MMRISMRIFLLLATVTAFCPLPVKHHSTSLRVSWWDSDDESRHAAMRNNIMRTDLRNFLTQRSIQSFIHLCMECRDPHTVKWLEDFGGWKNLENFHGTGALNITTFPSWSTFFSEVMKQPEDVIVVSAKRRGRGHGGWSKNNPYLEDRYVEFNIDIDPPSLANRMLAVREQIGDEWVADLDTLKVVNDQILDNYNEKIRKAREEEKLAHEEEIKARAAEEAKDQEDDDDDDNYVHVDRLAESKSRAKVAFDRNGMFFLRNSHAFCGDRAPSPLRQGNFDLLVLLATQESVHRVLRDYVDAGNEREMSFQWFRDFYVQRVAKYFDGNGEHGRADDFLEELMLTPPSVKSDEAGKVGLVDPLRIAENILSTRSKVCTEWKEIVSYTKEDHTVIRKQLLEKQMLKWGHKPKDPEPVEETIELAAEHETTTIEPVADPVKVTTDSAPTTARLPTETTVKPVQLAQPPSPEAVKTTKDSMAESVKGLKEPIVESVQGTKGTVPKAMESTEEAPVKGKEEYMADVGKDAADAAANPVNATTKEPTAKPEEVAIETAPHPVNTTNETVSAPALTTGAFAAKPEKPVIELAAKNPAKTTKKPTSELEKVTKEPSTKPLKATKDSSNKPLKATKDSSNKPLKAAIEPVPKPVKTAKEPADYIVKGTKEPAFKSVTSSTQPPRKPLPPPVEEEIEVYGEFQ